MKKIRTFIAHSVPEEWKEIIGEASASLREGLESRIAWVKPENMHFTLKFLGSIEEDKLAEVQGVLKKIPVVNFKISTAGAGFFPGSRKATCNMAGNSRWSQGILLHRFNYRIGNGQAGF